MFRIATLFLIAATLFLFSNCNNTPKGDMELNGDAKWQINAEMMPPLQASNHLLSEYANNANKDYKALAEKLSENNKTLISSCTMSGKSHDELHKWLHPYMGLVGDLANAKDQAEAEEILSKIEASFNTFNKYFE